MENELQSNEKKEYIQTHYTMSTILERGWTKTMIRNLLGECDKYGNGLYKRQPSQLYLIERVEQAEQTEEFKKLFAKKQANSEARKNGAKKAVETKIEKLKKEIENMEIEILLIENNDILMNQAIRNYKDLMENRNRSITVDLSNKAEKERIVVNYIRHCLTSYDYHIYADLYGKVGKYNLWYLFQKRIYLKIAEVYPKYKKECSRQYNYKTGRSLFNE